MDLATLWAKSLDYAKYAVGHPFLAASTSRGACLASGQNSPRSLALMAQVPDNKTAYAMGFWGIETVFYPMIFDFTW